jgi:hypothetical protein
VEKKAARFAMQRFAAYQFKIRRLYRSDQEFRELCDILSDASEALERWKSDARKVQEYREIVEELEAEMIETLTGAEKAGFADRIKGKEQNP